MDVQSNRLFQQSLCESRSIVDNLDPTSARLINELQKQLAKAKGDYAAEKQKCRYMARDHLVELKRLREEHERRLDSSLEALNLRKDQEKEMELKRLEEQMLKQKDQEVRFLNREKGDEMRALERKLHREHEENLRYNLENQRRRMTEEFEALKIPDEEEAAKRESKLMKEVFDLGDENMRLEEQVKNLSSENRAQIEQLRRMKQEHKSEIDYILRQNKTEAARDMARLKLAEEILHEKDSDLMEISQRVEVVELERGQLEAEVTLLKSVKETNTKRGGGVSSDLSSSLKKSGGMLSKRLDELQLTIKKLEEEKSQLKQENASLRKKLAHSGDTDSKLNKEVEDKTKKLRKRNADLISLVKTMDERLQAIKTENERMKTKQTYDSTESEQLLRKTLSRQHAKDISEYTRKIASRDRENHDLKRRLSKYEVTSGASHESASKLSQKLKMMSMEKIKMEKLVAKLYKLPDASEVELLGKDISKEISRLDELMEENSNLKSKIAELEQPSEVDGKGARKTGEHTSDLEVVRELREDNHKLQTELQEFHKITEERDHLIKEVADLRLAVSSGDKRFSLQEEDLEQAHLLSQDFERVQEHCGELDKEVTETRGLLNEKDREICQLELEKKTRLALLQEKDEEIEMLKEKVASLKNELFQSEELGKQLQTELELAAQEPDITHIGMQTSPLLHPKMYPRSSQTSPMSSPKMSPKGHNKTKLEDVPEDNGSNEISSLTTKVLNTNGLGFDLHSEMQAAGEMVVDFYDSDNFVEEEINNTVSSISLSSPTIDKPVPQTSNTSITNTNSDMVDSNKAPPSIHPLVIDPVEMVSLYIACDTYSPSMMSPNPDSEVELPLKKGDYVYVYGEEDEDGFYTGRLVSGRKGLVPSNYIRKLSDDAFPFSPGQEPNPTDSIPIPPPLNLELNRQFVQDDAYCLAVHWDHPSQLPSDATGYNIYINNTLDTTVELSSETFILLSGIPRNQYTCVSVRTVTSRGESTDPVKIVEINPQYPIPPGDLTLQEPKDSQLYSLMWSLTSSDIQRTNPPPITSYRIYLNKKIVLKSTPVSNLVISRNMACIELCNKDLDNGNISQEVDLTPPYFLTIQACNDSYSSGHSPSVVIPDELVTSVLPFLADLPSNVSSTQPSDVSLESGISNVHMNSHSESGSRSQITDIDEIEEITEVIIGSYYKALYSYDPQMNSPNPDGVEEELAFDEDDIILAVGDLDDDGFFLGDREGYQGLVPKNMVQHINEPTTTLVADIIMKEKDSSTHLFNGDHRLVEALYDYNPSEQSPNENPEEELSFQEGDYISVNGEPDNDGFYQGELKGKTGLVPKAFVRPISSSEIFGNIKTKEEVSPLGES